MHDSPPPRVLVLSLVHEGGLPRLNLGVTSAFDTPSQGSKDMLALVF